MSKDTGLEDRYQVIKRSNPNKEMDCIVLEFDDQIARVGIFYWAKLMQAHGYDKVYEETMAKMRKYGQIERQTFTEAIQEALANKE